MIDHLSDIREILLWALADGPQLGARLRSLVSRAFEAKTGTPYENAFAGYQNFSSVLREFPDLLQIDRPSRPGDITVQLRDKGVGIQSAQDAPSVLNPTPIAVRAELWNAFTNPDPHRRRFANKESGQIAHYLMDSESQRDKEIEARVSNYSNFVEIPFATADEQREWMREFVQSPALPEARQVLFADLLNLDYSSRVNALLTKSLEEFAPKWSSFRAEKVLGRITRWCKDNDLRIDFILHPKSTIHGPAVPQFTRLQAVTAQDESAEAALRRALHRAIDALSFADLTRISVPSSALLQVAPKASL